MTISTVIKKLSMATAGAAFIALGVAGTAQAQTVIDTTLTWDGTTYINPFGESNTATYGQTFTVGSDNVLNEFTFWLNDFNNQPDVVDFAAYVMEWDGSKGKGSILYDSGVQSTTNAQSFEKFTFNTGGINLTSGQQYVAFLSASNYFDGIEGQAGMGFLGSTTQDIYSGGDFVFYNNGNNFNLLTQNNWDSTGQYLGDAAFKASFNKAASVPEPGSMLGVLAVGAFGATSLLKRKHQQKAAAKA